MDDALVGLEPELVWKYFDAIRQIPRCSKHEEKAAEYVLTTARNLGLEARKDETGNVVVIKPPTPGYEGHESVCLQGHLDMVCEKNADVEHDFSSDHIKLKRDGDYITAEGTTLGADNGIGVALLLALAEAKDIKHPPLELLFTVDEETGMTGAFNMKTDFIRSKRLINVDSEELGTIYIGCAGGGDTTLTLPMGPKSPATGMKGLEFVVKGLKGGHSGVDIHLGRANAIKCLGRLIWSIASNGRCMLADINGGNKRNAIPREARATVLVEDFDSAVKIAKEIEGVLRDEYEDIEEGITIEHRPVDISEGYSPESTKKLAALIMAIPHGYLAFNPHMKDLVETSTNLATISIEGGNAVVGMSSRSSMKSAMESVRDTLIAIGTLAGAEGVKGGSYPSWKPNVRSNLLAVARDVYKSKFAKEAEIKAIHAGLETAIIGEHFPGMDMISIGPQIEFPHSPDERVEIKSVKTIWDYITALLVHL